MMIRIEQEDRGVAGLVIFLDTTDFSRVVFLVSAFCHGAKLGRN
jgi:hypothetical protein